MESQNPLSAKRLHALIGDKIHEFPPYFIERLERKLEEFEASRENPAGVVHLHLVPDLPNDARVFDLDSYADRHRKVAMPIATLQGIGAILEILHSVQVGRQEGGTQAVLSDHLVEGLITAGRALVDSSIESMWSAT
ncbi:hypothetical protein IFT63_10895 [Stenotrophomonas sp. CFBP 13724]|jgi:hypothetical protein|uniref:hypothetical protein n=1 Tax=Stenotrophomonas sp. CFBP 13724 TaxID=2775298 RepID=UPI00178046E5|nr:hypothetical protein [Stenotrophomonas sp. CFBP 13724]MBD8644092.1 hypothetical protein [Stenotrophomonas sp. CFBP 13724]